MYTETFISPVPFSVSGQGVPWTQNSRYEQKMGEEGTKFDHGADADGREDQNEEPFGRECCWRLHDLCPI